MRLEVVSYFFRVDRQRYGKKQEVMPKTRRFQSPWSVDDIGGCFVVKASNGRPLVLVYYGEGVAHRSLARLLTRDAARRIAAGLAKLPDLAQWFSKAAH